MKTLYRAQRTQTRAACKVFSYDTPLSNDEVQTYFDFIEDCHLIHKQKSVEEIVILREECREAVRHLPPERRREPEIAALIQQIAI